MQLPPNQVSRDHSDSRHSRKASGAAEPEGVDRHNDPSETQKSSSIFSVDEEAYAISGANPEVDIAEIVSLANVGVRGLARYTTERTAAESRVLCDAIYACETAAAEKQGSALRSCVMPLRSKRKTRNGSVSSKINSVTNTEPGGKDRELGGFIKKIGSHDGKVLAWVTVSVRPIRRKIRWIGFSQPDCSMVPVLDGPESSRWLMHGRGAEAAINGPNRFLGEQ